MGQLSLRGDAWLRGIALFLLCLSIGTAAQAHRLTVLYSLCRPDQYCGASAGGLTRDPAGDFYAVSNSGGAYDGGIVYGFFVRPGRKELVYRVLYNFCAATDCTDGNRPQGKLIIDRAGNLYGTTFFGGLYGGITGLGTIYMLSPNADRTHWTHTVLYNFCSKNSACWDGGVPTSGLTYAGASAGTPYDGTSPLFGATVEYGQHGSGTAFSITPHGGIWTYRILYTFCSLTPGCADGFDPSALFVEPQGTIVGTTSGGGGAAGAGAAFRLTPRAAPAEWSETVLYSFCQRRKCVDGENPIDPIVEDSSGAIWGEIEGAGPNGTGPDHCYDGICGWGLVYKIAPDNTETVIHAFCSRKDCSQGGVPSGGLTIDPEGNLYGATQCGGLVKGADQPCGTGEGGGTVFEISAGKIETLQRFCAEADCPEGAVPRSGVALDASGNIYGTTSTRGKDNSGTLFRLTP